MWECPECHKEFAKQNQSHKCEIVGIDTLFIDKKPELKVMYAYLLEKMSKIGNFKVTTSKKAITLYAENRISFMGIVIKNNYLDIWFALNEQIDEFPIYKILQAAKNKFGHFVRLYEKEEVDKTLIEWIKQSYTYINNK